MTGTLDFLKDKDTLLIFTYAPAGLGHLRVTDALYDGLPEDIPHVILGSKDKTSSYFHRLTSIHPVARFLFEGTQKGLLEDIFTFFYRIYLRKKTKLFYQELLNILKKRSEVRRVLVISTHFALAHKLGKIKTKIEKETGIKFVLVLQVTDDSPQQIWYVPEADIIFVPSKYTKDELIKYAEKAHLKRTLVEVLPYPVSPYLSWRLSEKNYKNRVAQVTSTSRKIINVSIPISGAAVGMDYFLKLTKNLHKKSERFMFQIALRKTIYTRMFLKELERRDYDDTHAFDTDKEAIQEYEEEYKNKVISLEITKPSEQSFKTFLNPTQIGGAILLFTRPIGRQEYDNINFLRKHYLVPENELQKLLWNEAQKDAKIEESILKEAKTWRGLRIPDNPRQAADFIFWSLKQGIFYEMMKYRTPKNQEKINEVNPNGVYMFWQRVAEYLAKRYTS